MGLGQRAHVETIFLSKTSQEVVHHSFLSNKEHNNKKNHKVEGQR